MTEKVGYRDNTDNVENVSTVEGDSTTQALDKLKESIAGKDQFIELLDTPASYTDQAGKLPNVNSAENGLEFNRIAPSEHEQATEPVLLADDKLAIWKKPSTGTTENITDLEQNWYPVGPSYTGQDRKEGQQFTAPVSDEVIAVRVKANSAASSVTGEFLVRIAEDNAGNVGTILASSEAKNIADDYTGDIVFTFPNPASVTLGTKYWIIIDWNGDNGQVAWFFNTTSSVYPDNARQYIDGWQAPGDFDFNMDIYFGNLASIYLAYRRAEGDNVLVKFGLDRFIELYDVPSSYSGSAGKVVSVKSTEDGLEFTEISLSIPVTKTIIVDGERADSYTPDGSPHYPFKTIQYMSVGVTPVASKVGGNKEIIQDGVNGFLASNKEDWVKKLSILIKDAGLRKDMGLNGRKTVEERYSLKTNGPKLLDVIERVYRENEKNK